MGGNSDDKIRIDLPMRNARQIFLSDMSARSVEYFDNLCNEPILRKTLDFFDGMWYYIQVAARERRTA